MAESTVVFFLEKLSDLLVSEVTKIHGAEEQLRLLQTELEWMRLFLRNADANRKYDDRLKLLVNQIRDVTYSAEDVIDEFIFKLQSPPEPPRQHKFVKLGFLTCCLRAASRPLILYDLGARITAINARIEKISTNKSRYFGIENVPHLECSHSFLDTKEKRLPVVEEVDVVGVEDGFESVRQLVLSPESRRAVVSIVGMGGLGKTTLAKRVYNCTDIKRRFSCHAWVYVSQEYRTKDLLVGVAKDATKLTDVQKIRDLEAMEVSELGSKISDFLMHAKYLIVLDDIWRIKDWDDLNRYLPDSSNGSRILITSRKEDIALHADLHSKPHALRLLNDVESWELFVQKVLGVRGSNAACALGLEDLGKKIVGKCGGLPLAVVVLGGLLSRKEKSQNSWQRVLDSVNWHLSYGPNSCMAILALSYHDLPYYLKSCFLYCGLFPEDHKIKVKKLLHFWVAEGFIEKRGRQTVLEDVAEDYLDELLARNLIQVSKRRSNGGVKSCHIHDLLRDLAISEAKDSKLFEMYESIDFTSPASVRRLVVHDSSIKGSLSRNLDSSHVRSLICFADYFAEESWKYFGANVKLITVVSLEGMRGIHTLPGQIGRLIHLKLLCLRRTGISSLPRSICQLTKLQTLDVRDIWTITIPPTIWELHQLRHFYGGCSTLRLGRGLDDDLGLELLTSLQTLELQVGSWLKDVGKLIQLRKLVIRGDLSQHDMLFSKCICELTGLRSLYLLHAHLGDVVMIPEFGSLAKHTYLYKMVLEGKLQKLPTVVELFPPNLVKLELAYSQLRQDPMSALELLPSLKILLLRHQSYLGKKMHCSAGGFRQLNCLCLHSLEALEEWEIEEGALPLLGMLKISRCERMKTLPNGLVYLQNLVELKIGSLDTELASHFRDLSGEHWDNIRHIRKCL